MKEFGKVGDLRFTYATTDTTSMVVISKGGMYSAQMVMILGNELTQVADILKSFEAEIEKKSGEQVALTDKTASLLLSCSYIKNNGWMIMIQHSDPRFQKASEGTGQNYFVEIKPKQINDVIKMITKAEGFK